MTPPEEREARGQRPASVESRPPLYTRAFLLTAFAHLLFFLSLNGFNLLPLYIKHLHGTEAQIGFIMGMSSLASILFQPLAGVAIDRAGPKRFLYLEAVICLVATAGFLVSDALNTVFPILRFLHGVGFSFYFTANFIFRHKVLRLLLDEEAIDEQVVANLLAWPHTGFGAHLSRAIPTDPVSRENVARYLAHSPIILDHIVGDPSAGKILYTGEAIHPRHRANFRVFDPLAFLAEICTHIPDPHEKTAIYYGWYSNRTRRFRKARGLLPPVTPDQPTGEAERAPLALRRT